MKELNLINQIGCESGIPAEGQESMLDGQELFI